SGSASRAAALEQAAAARPPGAHLERAFAPNTGREVRVDPRGDLDESAADVLTGAFSRARTLSGQLPGRIDTVLCPPRCFSVFSERLLARLDACEDAGGPVPLIDAEALEELQAVRSRGLDEGATLVRGGEALPGARGLAVRPLVFTNVELDAELLRLPAPGPVLRLARAEPSEGPSHPREGGWAYASQS
ncbi:MAG: aldehyde dehydrogenase family protein, partial [Planctomycetota bacterium]